jgi:hypothetical protein
VITSGAVVRDGRRHVGQGGRTSGEEAAMDVGAALFFTDYFSLPSAKADALLPLLDRPAKA